ncbi:Gfo/Idh/MocA family protein [Paenibacillus sp. GCM10027628]|uniref:Gfo/Idh/MocA family protein n=1 Tax=Paenibacillus sp. GCM10027628 TaxID=3273413 RepID=UPI003624F226
MKHFRIGLIGLGGMAQAHIKHIQGIENFSITAICDVTETSLAKVGAQLQLPEDRWFTNYKELITDSEVDIIASVTPNDVHAEIIRACLEANKPFMAEKPFTRTFEEAADLHKLYSENPVPAMVSFVYRYTPAFRYAKELIAQGKIGTVRSASIQYLQGWGAVYKNVPYLWRFNKEISGTGTLGDLGSHMIDMAHYLFGSFQELSAQLQTFVPEREDPSSGRMVKVEVDDFASFQARLEKDIVCVFQTTRNAVGSGNQHEASIYGDHGTLHASTVNPDELVWIYEDQATGQLVRQIVSVPESVKITQWDDFLQLLLGTPRVGVPGFMDGYENQKVLEAIVRADATKSTVRLDEM